MADPNASPTADAERGDFSGAGPLGVSHNESFRRNLGHRVNQNGIPYSRQTLDSRGFSEWQSITKPDSCLGRRRSAPGSLYGCGRHGQSAIVDELRPLYATSSDVAEGKELAGSSCSKCHGGDGVSTTNGVPNLAGQRPSYLYLELKADQLGDRSGGGEAHSMKLMKFLSDDALANVAAYYASLDPASPPDTPAPKYDDPVAAGKTAAQPCAKCHGENGVSHKAGVPSLIGLHPKYLLETMQSYKSGDRPIGPKNQDMKKALDALSDQDLQHVALYYALQSENLTRAQTPNDGGAPADEGGPGGLRQMPWGRGNQHDPDHAEPRGPGCGLRARRASRLQGRNARRRHDVPEERRSSTTSTMKNLAAYFAGLDPKPVNIPKPLSPGRVGREMRSMPRGSTATARVRRCPRWRRSARTILKQR